MQYGLVHAPQNHMACTYTTAHLCFSSETQGNRWLCVCRKQQEEQTGTRADVYLDFLFISCMCELPTRINVETKIGEVCSDREDCVQVFSLVWINKIIEYVGSAYFGCVTFRITSNIDIKCSQTCYIIHILFLNTHFVYVSIQAYFHLWL